MSTALTKIAEMTPNSKGFDMLFQINEILSFSNNHTEMICRIIDETGIINAYFNQYVKYLAVGNVYKMTSLRTAVVDNQIRIQMTKDTTVEKQPYKMGFKDKTNDLSLKLYIAKSEQLQKEDAKQQVKVEQIYQQRKQSNLNYNKKNNSGFGQKNGEKEVNRQINKKKFVQKDKQEWSQKQERDRGQQNSKYMKKQQRNRREQRDEKQFEKSYTKNSRSYKQSSQQNNILLRQMGDYQQRKVNLKIYIKKHGIIEKDNYLFCKVADSSGSAYIQLNKNAKIQEKGWYFLQKFKVYADREYGYVGVQEKGSTIRFVEGFESVYENQQIKF